MNPREALAKWLDHDFDCPARCTHIADEWCAVHRAHSCTCGLDAALASLEAEGRPAPSEDDRAYIERTRDFLANSDDRRASRLLAIIDRLTGGGPP